MFGQSDFVQNMADVWCFFLATIIIASFAIEIIRRRFDQYGDMATAIVMSTGIGLAAVLSDFTPGGTSFESFMFGSITTVSVDDLILVGVIFVLVVVVSLYFYNALLFVRKNSFKKIKLFLFFL